MIITEEAYQKADGLLDAIRQTAMDKTLSRRQQLLLISGAVLRGKTALREGILLPGEKELGRCIEDQQQEWADARRYKLPIEGENK
jgi:hypothetical protein